MIYYKISKEIFTQVKFFRQKAELKDSAMHVSSHTSSSKQSFEERKLLKRELKFFFANFCPFLTSKSLPTEQFCIREVKLLSLVNFT